MEAVFFLAWGRIQKMLPFSRIAPRLGEHMAETPFMDHIEHRRTIRHISRALHIARRAVFWESECLVMAFAAMRMLARRGIDSTLYMGTARNAEGKLIAHAWLRSGTIYVTGADEMERYVVVSTFARCVPGPEKLGENVV